MMNPKQVGRGLLAGLAAMVAVALAAPLAQAETPAPGFSQFTGCPSLKENASIEFCVHSTIKGGHFKLGNKEVPISKPITITGGTDAAGRLFANSQGGLTPVKEQVPGGVIGLTGLDWLVNLLNVEALKLYAVTEAVGQGSVGFEEITLPIRVHLINPVLGNSCYVGSPASPISLHLITGTTSPPLPNKPITGKAPELGVAPPEILTLTNGTYVDNSFSAPGASGCTLTLFGFLPIDLDPIVDLASGLPAKAGTNETVQNIDSELAGVTEVYP
jgi:hypothetical protein